MDRRLNFAILSMTAALTACGGGSSEKEDTVAGTCNIIYSESVISITSATDSFTQSPISELFLGEVSFNGTGLELTSATRNSRNITIVGSGLLCKVPCAFANEQGTYKFVAGASGYSGQNVTVQAVYARLTGNCPAIYSGPTAVALSLVRQ